MAIRNGNGSGTGPQGSSPLIDDSGDMPVDVPGADRKRAASDRPRPDARSGAGDGGTAPPLVGFPLDGNGPPMRLDD